MDLCGKHPFTMGCDGVVDVELARKLGSEAVALLCADDVTRIEMWPADAYEGKLGNHCGTASDVVRFAEQHVEAMPDGDFRLPMDLLERASIQAGSACAAVGVGDCIEIWNRDLLDESLKSIDFFAIFEPENRSAGD